MGKSLTETGSRQHACHQVWRRAIWKNRLQNVAGESEGNYSKCGWIHDEHGTPQQEKSGQGEIAESRLSKAHSLTGTLTHVHKFDHNFTQQHRWTHFFQCTFVRNWLLWYIWGVAKVAREYTSKSDNMILFYLYRRNILKWPALCYPTQHYFNIHNFLFAILETNQ